MITKLIIVIKSKSACRLDRRGFCGVRERDRAITISLTEVEGGRGPRARL
jgi:hypothetical protein